MIKKDLILTSLNRNKYPDKKIECVFVKDIKVYVKFRLENGAKVKRAQKTASVKARVGVLGEEVDTRPRVERDGKIYVIGETKGKVKVEGSRIVENPDGEEYIVLPDKFAKKYSPTSQKGVYKPNDGPIDYIKVEEDIAFTAPWGEDMYAIKGAVLNITNSDDIYAIQNVAVEKTYTEYEHTKE